MKINEVEKLLEIPKATIRFYEKEGLVTPQRKENSYREYSDEDLEVLKKIIVLRKIGVAVEDIKQVLNNQLSLQEALSKNITSLYEQMEEIQGAIKVCSLMQEKEEDIETFDENYYWNVIHVEEENGQSFIDVAKDYLQFEKALLDNVTGGGNKRFAVIAISLLIAAIVRGVVSFMTGTGFLNGFLGAFVVLVTVSVIFLPAFLLRKRESAKEKYVKSIGRMAAIFLILVFFLVVIMLLNGKLHFLF